MCSQHLLEMRHACAPSIFWKCVTHVLPAPVRNASSVLCRNSLCGKFIRMERVRARVKISGLVQGVFFRASTRDEAIKERLVGWVRNLPDGTVEAVLEGGKDGVCAMLKWCEKGPSPARVDSLDITWEDAAEANAEFKDFSILY